MKHPSPKELFIAAIDNPTLWKAWKAECLIFQRHDPFGAEEVKMMYPSHYRAFREFADEQERLHELVTSRKSFVL